MDRLIRARVVLKLEQLDSKLKSFLANIRARNPRDCASSMYFAVFHAAEALLYARGIQATSYRTVANLLALHFVRPGTLPRDTSAKFSVLMAGRHDADYNEAIPFGAEDARAVAATGLALLAELLRVLDDTGGGPPTRSARRLQERIAAATRGGDSARRKRARRPAKR